jgi:hypothetical protein
MQARVEGERMDDAAFVDKDHSNHTWEINEMYIPDSMNVGHMGLNIFCKHVRNLQ